VRWLSSIILFVVFLSCREIQPFDQFIPIQGYQLNGTVTTPNGIPLDSVEVRLWYTYRLYQTTPLDTVQVVVTDSTKIVYVAVYTQDFIFVKELFFGFRRTGVLPRFPWDEKDSEGKFVPSGKYFVSYSYDNVVVKDVPYIAEGHTTTVTDRNGRFSLTNANLPIGEAADFYRSNGQYEGTFVVMREILLEFVKGGAHNTYRVVLERDKLIRGSFTVQ